MLSCRIYANVFRGHILDAALHGLQSFVLQRIIERSSREEVNMIITELVGSFEDLLAENKGSQSSQATRSRCGGGRLLLWPYPRAALLDGSHNPHSLGVPCLSSCPD